MPQACPVPPAITRAVTPQRGVPSFVSRCACAAWQYPHQIEARIPVAQVFNLLYRRVALGKALKYSRPTNEPTRSRVKICDTAQGGQAATKIVLVVGRQKIEEEDENDNLRSLRTNSWILIDCHSALRRRNAPCLDSAPNCGQWQNGNPPSSDFRLRRARTRQDGATRWPSGITGPAGSNHVKPSGRGNVRLCSLMCG